MSKEFDEYMARKSGAAEPPGAMDRLWAGVKSNIHDLEGIPEGLYYMAKPAFTGHPEQYPEMAKQMGKGVLDYYGKYLDDPVGQTLDNPLNTAFDLATLWSLGLGTASRAVGSSAARAAVGAAGPAREGFELAQKAAKLQKMSTPHGLLSLGKEGLISSAERDLAKGMLRPEEMSLAGKTGLHIKNWEAQREASKLRNWETTARYQTYGEIEQELEPIFGKLTPEETIDLARYAQVPKSRLPKEFVDAIEQNPKLKTAFDALGEYAKKQELADVRITPEMARAREVKPTAIADLRKEIEGFDELRYKEPGKYEKLISDRVAQIRSGEDVSNLRYIMHLDPTSELRGRPYYMGQVPKLENLREGIRPDYMKQFTAGPETPLDLKKSVLTREILRESDARNAALAHKIAKDFGQGIYKPGMTLPPHLTTFNPTLDTQWARYTKQAADHLIKKGLDPVMATKQAEQFLGRLRESIDTVGWADAGPTAEAWKFTDAVPELHDLIQNVARRNAEGTKFAISRLQAKNPTYIIPRAVKQMFDKSASMEETSKVLKALYDTPTRAWRKAVLGLSPRWPLYNIAGNITAAGLKSVTPGAYKTAMDIMRDPEAMKLLPPSIKQTLAMESQGGGRYGFGLKNIEASLSGASKENFQRRISGKPITVQTEAGPMTSIKPGEWTEIAKKSAKPVEYTMDFMTNANDKIEKFFRTAMYIDEVQKEAKRLGMLNVGKKAGLLDNLSQFENLKTLMKDEGLQKAALEATNDFMFDYSNLSRLERGVFRRVMPFYSFYSNLVKLVYYRLPAKYPVRNSVLHGLARMGQDAWHDDLKSQGIDPKSLPDWLQGSIPIHYDPKTRELNFINTQGPNIFATASFDNVLGSLHPALKIGLERLLNMDLFRGKKFTSPYLAYDYAGQLHDLRTGKVSRGESPGLIEHIARQFPQYQALKDVVRQKQFGTIPMEYDTNTLFSPQPIGTKKGGFKSTRGPWQSSGLKLLGLPYSKIKVAEKEKSGKMSKTQKGADTLAGKQIKQMQDALKKRKF